MRALQDVKQSGLETTLLVDPVDDFAIGGVAGDGFAQELADAGVVVGLDGFEQFVQSGFQNVPRKVILIGAHDHRMRCRCDVIPDEQFLVEFSPGRKPVNSMEMSP